MARILVSVGEPSGDQLAAPVVARLVAAGHRVAGVGGPACQQAGLSPVAPFEGLAAHGLAGAAASLPAFRRALRALRDRASDVQAVRQVTGWDTPQFMDAFKNWARQQVVTWGLQPQPHEERVAAFLQSAQQGGDSLDRSVLNALLEAYPEHPDLLKESARLAVASGDAALAKRAILDYASVRPVDPWADQQWVKLAQQAGKMSQAVASLERLDAMEVHSGQWAVELAKFYRGTGRLDQAGRQIERALHREPYRADHRELAAAIHLQRNDPASALRHLQAAAILEPRRVIHRVRLAALYARMDRPEDAQAAAQEALKLDPDAPVGRFMSPE